MNRILLITFLLIFGLAGCAPKAEDEPHSSFVPVKPEPPEGMDPYAALGEYADVLRSDPSVAALFSDSALTAVTREYGPTVISSRAFPYASGVLQASHTPWSSWWYPKKETSLFADSDSAHLSPLSQYDLVRKHRYKKAGRKAPHAAAVFERKSSNSSALSWEGLCDAWALASIIKPEPTRSVTLRLESGKVTFGVGAQKALLLKTFEGVDDSSLLIHGQKFTGDFDGWLYPDMFPDQFHRFLEIQLGIKKQGFVMDHDPGPQVWNVPVFKANFTVNSIPGQADAVFVRAWVYSAESSPRDKKDFVGTIEATREYDYVLLGVRNAAGDLVVKSGYWVVGPDGLDSRKDHPDYVMGIADPDRLVRKSWNPEIEVDIVDAILSGTD